jgi:hypothetical protein
MFGSENLICNIEIKKVLDFENNSINIRIFLIVNEILSSMFNYPFKSFSVLFISILQS